MRTIGYLQARAYTSRAKLPLEGTAVTVVDPSGRLLGLRLTDSSGLTTPITIEVPDKSNSLSPQTGKPVDTTVNLYARLDGYAQILVEDVQIFADVVTVQDLPLVPLSELPEQYNPGQVILTPPQNL